MTQVIFRNFDRSEFVERVATDRIQEVLAKFPEFRASTSTITLYMDNSPVQAGPDLFGARLYVKAPRGRALIIEKSDLNMHMAIAKLSEALLERLHRFMDKERSVQRRRGSKIQKKAFWQSVSSD